MALLRPCSDSPEMSRMAGLALCTQGSGRLPLSAWVCASILWCFPCRDLTCTQNGWGTGSHCFSLYWAQTVPSMWDCSLLVTSKSLHAVCSGCPLPSRRQTTQILLTLRLKEGACRTQLRIKTTMAMWRLNGYGLSR